MTIHPLLEQQEVDEQHWESESRVDVQEVAAGLTLKE
jgi:hypothetical protein